MLLNAIPIDLRKLGHFQAVAEELNFTRAARRVHLTQQALSTSVRQLERELGVVLMERSTRDVRLTEAGRALLDEAPRLLALAEVAASRAVAAERGEVGELRVGHTPAVTGKEVNAVAVRVRQLHPGIRISARQMYPHELIDGLLAARIDVGLGRGFASRAGVKVSVLAQQAVQVAVARDHPLAGRDLVKLVELEPYPLVS